MLFRGQRMMKPATRPSRRPLPATETRELFHACMVLQGRADAIWERLIYAHAAVATVMAFLVENGSVEQPYIVTRTLVFSFYTVNLIFQMVAMWESYLGLQAGLSDLRDAHEDDDLSHLDLWMLRLNYRRHPWRRIVLLGLVWLMVGYLMFDPVCGRYFGEGAGVCDFDETLFDRDDPSSEADPTGAQPQSQPGN